MTANGQTARPLSIPPELVRSTPRPVRLTGAGRFVAAIGVLLALGAAVAFAGLLGVTTSQRARAARFEADGRSVDAEILSVRRRDGTQRTVRYRYDVSGQSFEGSTRLRARAGLVVGGPLPVVYLPESPADHYVQARGLRPAPFWLVPFVPTTLLLLAWIVHVSLRTQRRLAEDGRPVIAAVTESKKQRHQHGSYFTVSYEFRLMNGATRRGSFQVQKDPPAPGTQVLVIYDRERPEHNKRYPISLARVALGD